MIVIQSRQIKAARALLGWSQEQLAQKANVSLGTIIRMESFKGAVRARSETLHLVVAVLEQEGIEFLNEDKPGVRLHKPLAKTRPKTRTSVMLVKQSQKR